MSLTYQMAAIATVILVTVCFQTRAVAVCDGFSDYPDAEIEEYFNILNNPKKTEIKRLFAYKYLVCSNDSVYRQRAFTLGLQGNADSMLRSQVLIDAMMARSNFVIDLIDSSKLSKESRKFIKDNGGQIEFQAYQKDPTVGCITIYVRSKCGGNRQVKISGQSVEVTYSPTGLYGRFDLTSENTLQGYVKSSRSKTGKIPSKLHLF